MKHIFILLMTINLFSQNYNVTGRITIGDSTEVQFAQITFVDNHLKELTTFSDSIGYYEINLITGIEDENKNVPQNVDISQNYPNPFSTNTIINYITKHESDLRLKIYDILGREIKAFNFGVSPSGPHHITWDGTNNFGVKVSTGIYIYVLESSEGRIAKKMVHNLANDFNSQTHFDLSFLMINTQRKNSV
ncbi:MAG: T9SS type A sorting domain-containing protein [Ignavibacteriaceae bacterium]|nr:T9SS type A sorting domain-containing protein [Ignavibacteriaceae bacterium]